MVNHSGLMAAGFSYGPPNGIGVAAGTSATMTAIAGNFGGYPAEFDAASFTGAIEFPSLNDSGRWMFKVRFANNQSVTGVFMVEGVGPAQTVARWGQSIGDPFPAGSVLRPIASGLGLPYLQPRINEQGDGLFSAMVARGGAETERAYLAGSPGRLRTLIRAGVTEAVNAPGVRPTLAFDDYQSISPGLGWNDLGQVALVDASPGTAGPIFAYDPIVGLVVLGRIGIPIDVRPGDRRTPSRFSLFGTMPPIRPYASGLSHRGVLAFAANFSDGTGAVFRTVVRCDADLDGDGFTDFFDLVAFVDAFEGGEPRADFNGDGFIDFFDFDAFVGAFERGCGL